MPELTDAEVICGWMEPTIRAVWEAQNWSAGGWWTRYVATSDYPKRETVHGPWHPRTLTLDALREVQSRLTQEQQIQYLVALVPKSLSGWTELWSAAHATAEQKIKALAAVLREEGKK